MATRLKMRRLRAAEGLALLAALLLQCRDAQGFAVCARHFSGSRRAPGDGVCRVIERTRNRASLRGVELTMAGDAEKGGLFGGFFSNMFGGAEESSPDKDRVVRAVSVFSACLARNT